MLLRRIFPLILAACFLLACSPRSYVVSRMADAASSGGEVFARDDDPELVRDAVPFALKSMESLLASSPDHKGLLTALCKGFTQYAVAFVRQDAEEALDPETRRAGMERSRRLLLRAREYGVRGLSAGREGFAAALSADPAGAAARVGAEDVPLLYWTAAAWSLAVASSPDDPALLADLPRCEALMRRALALDERYDDGAIHEFFVAFEGGRPEAMGGSRRSGPASHGTGDGAVRGKEGLAAGHLRRDGVGPDPGPEGVPGPPRPRARFRRAVGGAGAPDGQPRVPAPRALAEREGG